MIRPVLICIALAVLVVWMEFAGLDYVFRRIAEGAIR